MYTWTRFSKVGYELSSAGDKEFSAFYARLPDGRSIEQHYQCDVKGYDVGGTNWRAGKGKPPLDRTKDLYAEYLALWQQWAQQPNAKRALQRLRTSLAAAGISVLTDRFATTPVNQAHAIADLLDD